MSIQKVKLQHRTSGGTLVQSAVMLEFAKDRIWFLESPFILKDEIKSMKGSQWHGFQQENPRKIWSVADCQRNRFQLDYLMGKDVYEWFDQETIQHEYTRPLMEHQKKLADHFLTHRYGIMAAEMGCIEGNATVAVRVGGKKQGAKELTLAKLYREWTLSDEPFYVTGLKGYGVKSLLILNVIKQGLAAVVRVTLASGRTIRVTPDHELYYDADNCKRADEFLVGECVLAGAGRQVGEDQIVSIKPCGKAQVYDIRCEHPYHNFRANGIVVANCGKTLAVQEVMERSGIKDWFWIGPKTSLPNIEREFKKWDMDPSINVEMMTYEALKRVVGELTTVPQGVVFDESSRLKGATSQRSAAAQQLADMVREKYLHDGYVIEMSGTPSPKSPLDWFKQAEIAWPGFLKEGSPKAMERRMAFLADCQFDAGIFKKRIGWKDDETKCKHCGQPPHDYDGHKYAPSFNEVAYLYERLKGLVIIKHKKDCLNLPDKRYRTIHCKPSASALRVGQALVQSAPNTITGLTLLRELSDGFQYREKVDGTTQCTHCHGTKQVEEWFGGDKTYQTIDMLDEDVVATLEKRQVACPRCEGKGEMPKMIRITKEVPCPKDKALRGLLEECEETGRIVVFAGFTGSVDRVMKLCHKEGWDTVRCDGRGWLVTKSNGEVVQEAGLDYWSNMEHPRVAFVAHPESGGMSFTLTESRMVVYWSNSYKPEYRVQSEDRIHRIGMDLNKGCTIVDLIHLPTDQKVLDIIRENRRLELLTMGEIANGVKW